MGNGKRSEHGPGVVYRVVHLADQLVGVVLIKVAHPASYIEMVSHALHTVLGPVVGHVSEVCGSSQWVIEEHRHQALVLAVEASRDEDFTSPDGGSMTA